MGPRRNKALAVTKASRIPAYAYVVRDLMDTIARYLDIKDLLSMAQTCRLWRQAVVREMQFRCPQRIFLYEEENFFVLQGFVNVIPHLVMLFPRHDFTRDADKMREQTLCRQFMDRFPDILVTIGFEEVFTEANFINVDSLNFDEERNFANFENWEVPGLLISEHRTVDVQVIRCNRNAAKKAPFEAMFNYLKPKTYDEESILMAFMMHGFTNAGYLEALSESYKKCFSQYHRHILWGGEVFHPPCVYDRNVNESEPENDTGFFVVSISNPNLKAYSFVLNIHDISTDTFYEEIQRFRNGIKLRTYCIGLLIAPLFEEHLQNSDQEESNAQAYIDADDFYRRDYEKKLMYHLKRVFPGVRFTFLFQNNMLKVFGNSNAKDRRRIYHGSSFSLMILTHN